MSLSALNWKPFVYRGLTSTLTEFSKFPVDLTKTRLQIQDQKNDADFKQINEDRQRGRPEGTVFEEYPAMLHQASCGTIKIGTYQSLKRLFVKCPGDETLLINVVCGILSGVISSTISIPANVLKIQMATQNNTVQGGIIGDFINIY
ncbi:hypothetical protein Celaphus_00015957 [Cervus elaphus hippelaphus]|uniref:SLC25A30 n=1 Tax=Cervus elaphus hippelaphus TaxID=46360 RepID=A0A212C2Q2_CEREH|nr:hypothetical protein Celaphus_00015957 [Cervus elaphus hippelaphus]